MKHYNKILEAIDRGIQLALDDYEDEVMEPKKSSNFKDRSVSREYLDLMNIAVDFNLPSGTVWCKYNLGCNQNALEYYLSCLKPGELPMLMPVHYYGNYFAWGELEPKEDYHLTTYRFAKHSGYANVYYDTKYHEKDGYSEMELDDDVAYKNCHLHNFKFHIPSEKQFQELIDNVPHDYIQRYNDIRDLNGLLFKKGDKELFFPAGGYAENLNRENCSKSGAYWTRNLIIDPDEEKAVGKYFVFNDSMVRVSSCGKYFGLLIKPVCEL